MKNTKTNFLGYQLGRAYVAGIIAANPKVAELKGREFKEKYGAEFEAIAQEHPNVTLAFNKYKKLVLSGEMTAAEYVRGLRKA